MDKIRIVDLEVWANHGVYEEERRQGQMFLVCAEIGLNRGERTDALETTADYSAMCRDISEFFKSDAFNLIETAADQLALFILKQYPEAISAEIEIKKPFAPIGLKLKYVSAVCTRARHTVYLGLGSNLGDREKNLGSVIKALEARADCFVLKVSGFLNTRPYGKTDQPDFLNGCVKLSTVLSPYELLTVLQDLERNAGRVRGEKWGARTLDLDILFYDDLILCDERLTVPHADLHNRLFVLEPLCALEPNLIHPVFRLSAGGLLAALKKQA